MKLLDIHLEYLKAHNAKHGITTGDATHIRTILGKMFNSKDIGEAFDRGYERPDSLS